MVGLSVDWMVLKMVVMMVDEWGLLMVEWLVD
jgi:hypothetical protein